MLGGFSNAYGALLGGLTLGLAEEWSTTFSSPRLEVAIGFVVLIVVLLVRPNGLFGRATLGTDDRARIRVPGAPSHSDFWPDVLTFAGTYAIFTLGLQVNVGFTGI